MGSRLQVLGFGLWGGPQKVAFGSVQFGKLLDSFGFCCRTEPISAYARPGLHERDIQRPPVWQKAFQLTIEVYSVTRMFPREETYGLTSQLRRAAVSVVSNIAESKGRSTDKDALHFLSNAKGSLFELETQLELAKHLSYLTSSDADALISKTNEAGRLLSGLMRALRSSLNDHEPSAIEHRPTGRLNLTAPDPRRRRG